MYMNQFPSVFSYTDYKIFLRQWIKAQPRSGRGYLRKLALLLRVHSTLISQIVNGPRDFTLEQALEVSEHMELSNSERKYFFLLVQMAKSEPMTSPGSKKLSALLEAEAAEMRKHNNDLKEKFVNAQELDDQAKSAFYSTWTYSAIRLATDLPALNSAQSIGQALKLPTALVQDQLDFLTKYQLCKKTPSGKYSLGESITHIHRDSPHVANHHRNWRLKALECSVHLSPSDFVFTAPVVLSREHAREVAELLSVVVDRLKKLAAHSKSQELRVLNLDWIHVIDPSLCEG